MVESLLVPIFSCYLSGTILLRAARSACADWLARVLNICNVNDTFHTQLYTNVKCFNSLVDGTQHVRCMRSSIVAANPFLSSDSCVHYQTVVLMGNNSYILGNMSWVQRTLLWPCIFLESSLARFTNVVCCFQTISCLLSIKESQIRKWMDLLSHLFSLLWKRTRSSQMYSPKTCPS